MKGFFERLPEPSTQSSRIFEVDRVPADDQGLLRDFHRGSVPGAVDSWQGRGQREQSYGDYNLTVPGLGYRHRSGPRSRLLPSPSAPPRRSNRFSSTTARETSEPRAVLATVSSNAASGWMDDPAMAWARSRSKRSDMCLVRRPFSVIPSVCSRMTLATVGTASTKLISTHGPTYCQFVKAVPTVCHPLHVCASKGC